MKLSQIQMQEIPQLPVEQLAALLYGNVRDDGRSADVALLLGTSPKYHCERRALKAAELWHEGRFPYVVPTGGVEWDFYGEKMTEAEFMKKILLENGVPEEAILLENEATTTKENMMYGAIVLNRRLKLQNVKHVCIVTAANHMQRSMALAKLLLPRSVQISSAPSDIPQDAAQALREDSFLLQTAIRGIELTKGLIDNGLIDDIEIPLL